MSAAPRRLLGTHEFDVWLVGDRSVLRLPRSPAGGRKLLREAKLLALLGGRLPLNVPRPRVVRVAGTVASLHPYLAGRSGQGAALTVPEVSGIASQLGRTLARLHQIPLAGVGSRWPRHRTRQHQLQTGVKQAAAMIRARRPQLATAALERWVEEMPGHPLEFAGSVVCHGDIKGEHLLCDGTPARLVGLIDWADTCLSDPAHDLAGLVLWRGEEALRWALQAYATPFPGELLERALCLGRSRVVRNLGRSLGGGWAAPADLIEAQFRAAFAPPAG
ncbi:MAG: phosphotransferase family protein [Candidatus Dormibacteria bacterium]